MKTLIALFGMAFGGFVGVQGPAPVPTQCETIGCKPFVIITAAGGCAPAPFVTDGTVKTAGDCECVRPHEGAPVVCVPDLMNFELGRRCSIVGAITISNPAAAAGGFGGPGTCVCIGGFGLGAGQNGVVNVNMLTGMDCPGAVLQFSVQVKAVPCVVNPFPAPPSCPAGAAGCTIVVSLICMDCNLAC